MASQGNTEDKDKKNKVHCTGCLCELEADHTGVTCKSDHHVCPECSVNFVNIIFENPSKQIPLKCMTCRAEVITETFERQLNAKQAQTFVLFNMQFNPKFSLASDEIIAACPFCQYFEINTKDAGRLLFLCKRPDCMKSSCFWCKKVIANHAISDNNYIHDEDEDDEKYDIDADDMETHFICAQLHPLKEKWDKALADGNIRKCPGCALEGRKDTNCTHMRCAKCQTQWCYVCGLGLDKMDKRQGVGSIAGHNSNWRHNPKRCPMYLGNIHRVDHRWPDEPEPCVAFLHRLRTMQLLKNAVEDMGNDNFQKICNEYNVAEICGFDMDEVMKGDHRLIIRQIENDEDTDDSEWESDEDEDSESD